MTVHDKQQTPSPSSQMVGIDILLARVASIICEETCGLTSECKSREAANALFDKGYLATAPHGIEQLRDRAETAVVAANALQARLNAVEAALREQVDACDTDDCEMCHRHRSLLAKTEGSE